MCVLDFGDEQRQCITVVLSSWGCGGAALCRASVRFVLLSVWGFPNIDIQLSPSPTIGTSYQESVCSQMVVAKFLEE